MLIAGTKMPQGVKLRTPLFFVALLAAGCAGDASKDEVVLLPSRLEVVIAPAAPPSVRFAADELTNFLAQASGIAVPVVTEPTGLPAVFLGTNRWSAAAGVSLAGVPRDGFVIAARAASKEMPDSVFVVGADDPVQDPADLIRRGQLWPMQGFEHATAFGVYEFLERYVGCRFYFPGEVGTVVPRVANVRVPVGSRTVKPAFGVRNVYLNGDGAWPDEDAAAVARGDKTSREGPKALDWLRLRLQTERIPCCHGTNQLHPGERFAGTHPEYFALLKNRRGELVRDTNAVEKLAYHPQQLCHSSAVWDEFYRDAKSYLTGQPASSRKIPASGRKGSFAWQANCVGGKYVDVMPQDGMVPCLCAKCQAAYRKDDPDYATELVWSQTAKLANRLKAEGVGGFVTQMAYGPYGRVPDFDLPDNVRVMVAQNGPWSVLNDAKFAQERARIAAWAKKTGGCVWVWTYPNKYEASFIPDIPSFAPRAWGRYYQAIASDVFGSFAESETDRSIYNYLNYYVFSRVSWDPTVDVDAVLAEHHRLMFGAAAGELAQVCEEMEAAWLAVVGKSVDTPLGPVVQVPSEFDLARVVYGPDKLRRWRGLFDAAEAKTAGDAASLRRVRFFRVQFFGPLERKMAGILEAISVERELERRKGRTFFNLVDDKRWSRWPNLKGFRDTTTYLTAPDSLCAVTADDGTKELKRSYLGYQFLKEPFVLKPNTKYRVSFFVKAKDVVPLTKLGGVRVAFGDGVRETNFPQGALTGTFDWVHQSFEWTTSARIGKTPFLALRLVYALGEAWFDEVLVEEVR